MNNNYCNLLALYDNETILIKNIKILIKKNNCYINDIYSPYPIHGLNKLINLKNTNLSFLSFIYGLLGFLFSMILIWYIMIFDWPQNIGGKPYYSFIKNLPSFIPVIFELIIFFSAHLMCITYLFKCKLYPGCKAKNPDPRTTDYIFLIKIKIYKKNKNNMEKFLLKNGAIKVN
ncbi:DUF3341 domain-containing protein [Blattabacterium cuenoti]|uniref:DUF3341 domain-containing protein n=1 Tax=Blattabacterium cuenoti TaxID=1653831 RepID=UPI00163BAACB|nr:DUF3341 domain-containing protein [Blattabacterium cuenoti]